MLECIENRLMIECNENSVMVGYCVEREVVTEGNVAILIVHGKCAKGRLPGGVHWLQFG